MNINGCSTGRAPIHVNRINVTINIQNTTCFLTLNWFPCCFLSFFINGIRISIKIDIKRAITPPNLLGIERKIAYANKKYHSGLIWRGVTIELAIEKLSGSPK